MRGEHILSRRELSLVIVALLFLSLFLNSTSGLGGEGYFKPPYKDYGEDTDGDTKYNFLDFDFSVEINVSGTYFVEPALQNSSGGTIDTPDMLTVSGAGTHSLTVKFDGIAIYNSGEDGPYTIKLTLYDWGFDICGSHTNQTQSYLYTEFQPPPVEFNPPHYDYGIDTNSNTLYDHLVAVINITVHTADTYNIEGTLRDNSGVTWIAEDANQSTFSVGDHSVELRMYGFQIRKSGYDGPYTLELEILKGAQTMDTDTHMTEAYLHTDFEGLYAYFTPPHSDVGLDLDSDTLYDYLVVTVEIHVNESGNYRVDGDLVAKNGIDDITSTSNSTYLAEGSVQVDLHFLGCEICQSGEGTWYWAFLSLFLEDGTYVTRDDHQTNNYHANDFDCEPPIVFSPPHSDYGLDTNANVLYNYLVADISIDASVAWDYRIAGRLYNSAHTIFINATENTTSLSVGANIVPLWLNGWKIYNSSIDGPYNLTLYSYDVYGNQLEKAFYDTNSYTYDEFEHIIPDSVPPEIGNVLVNGQPSITVLAGTVATLTATIDDSTTGGSNIAGANYTMGSQNWPGTSMSAQDGGFNEETEDVTVSVDTSGWTLGDHDLYVYGWDDMPNYNTTSTEYARITIIDDMPPEISNALANGLPSVVVLRGVSVTLTAIIDDTPTGESTIGGANYTIGAQNWPGTAMTAQDGGFNEQIEDVTASIDTTGWALGSHDLYIYGWDNIPNHNVSSTEYATITVVDNLPPEISNVLVNGLPSVTVLEGVSVTLNATIDDAFTGLSTITGANYTIGFQNWPGTAMSALDGGFNEPTEDATATVDTTGWTPGDYDLHVYGSDNVPNDNTTSTAFARITIAVTPDTTPPEISNVLIDGSSSQTYYLSTKPLTVQLSADLDDSLTGNTDIGGANYTTTPSGWPGVSMSAQDGSFNSPTETAYYDIPTPDVGNYEYYVYAWDNIPNYNNTGPYASLEIIDDVPPEISNVLIDGSATKTIIEGTPSVTLTAIIDDSGTGGAVILIANYTIGPQAWPGWDMDASDGAYDESSEDVDATVDTSALTAGSYGLCVYAIDASTLQNENTTGDCALLEVIQENEPPEISNVLVDGQPSITVDAGTTVTLTASVDDTATGGSNIAGANYTIGFQNWPGTAMSAQDGGFNEPAEDVTASVDTTGWSPGDYDLYVYGCDIVPNCNTTSTEYARITIAEPPDTTPPEISNVLVNGQPSITVPAGTVVTLTAIIDDSTTGGSNITGANHTISFQNWPGTVMSAQDGEFNSPTETATVQVDTAGWAPGDYDLYVYGWDNAPNYNTTSTAYARITIAEPSDTTPPEISNVLIDGQPTKTVPISSLPLICSLTATIDDSGTGGSNITGANYTTPTPTSWPGIAMSAEDGGYNSSLENAVATFSAPSVVGSYNYYVYAWDASGNYNNTTPFATIIVEDDLPPEISNVRVNGMASISVPQGSLLALTASASDVSTGNSDIMGANYTDGFANWPSSMSMDAADMTFDSPAEDLTATIDTSTWTLGVHEIYVYAIDSANNGNVTSTEHVTVTITPPDLQPPEILNALVNGKTWVAMLGGDSVVLNATITDENTGDSLVGGANYTVGVQNWPGVPMNAKDGAFDSSIEDVIIIVDTTGWPMMNHTVCVYAWDIVPNENTSSNACVFIDILAVKPLPPEMIGADLSGVLLSDAVLRWSRSGDDGIGKDSVIEYDVYQATDHSGPYSYITSVPATNSPEYSWTCWGCGVGDISNYFFYVEADDGSLTRASPNKASKFIMSLTEGPQLISIPLITSSDDIAFVLQTIRFNMAYYYDSGDASDPWKSYMPFKAYKGDLRTVDRTMGLWVNVTSASDFVVAGLVPETTTITLRAGWNLVGFPSFATDYTVADLKLDVNASGAEEFDPLGPPCYLRSMSDTDIFSAGMAYWIEVPEDVVWTLTN